MLRKSFSVVTTVTRATSAKVNLPTAPKHKSSYNIFASEMLAESMKNTESVPKSATAKFTETMKLTSQKWKDMSNSEKAVYDLKLEAEKAKHKESMENLDGTQVRAINMIIKQRREQVDNLFKTWPSILAVSKRPMDYFMKEKKYSVVKGQQEWGKLSAVQQKTYEELAEEHKESMARNVAALSDNQKRRFPKVKTAVKDFTMSAYQFNTMLLAMELDMPNVTGRASVYNYFIKQQFSRDVSTTMAKCAVDFAKLGAAELQKLEQDKQRDEQEKDEAMKKWAEKTVNVGKAAEVKRLLAGTRYAYLIPK